MPGFAIHEGYVSYRGPSTDCVAHAHAAFQVAIALDGEVTMVDAAGAHHRAAVLAVPPMVPHRLLETTNLLTHYVDPHHASAGRLRELCGDGITEVNEPWEPAVRPAAGAGLDARLVRALEILAAEEVPIPDVAARVGLSPQRLRALARRQLGLPLARWRIWRRLGRATEALSEGRSPADAASLGGFADQAHFHRQMREMVGVTPSEVLRLVRGSAARDVDRDRAGDR